MLNPEQRKLLQKSILEDSVKQDIGTLQKGRIDDEAKARGISGFDVIKDRFASTPQEDRAPAILGGMFRGGLEGIETAKEGLIGADKPPVFPELQGGAGQGQQFGQMAGQALPTIAAGALGFTVGGPVGSVGLASLMAGATTPGTTGERAYSAGLEGTLGATGFAAPKLAGAGYKALKGAWQSWKAPKELSKKIKVIEDKLARTGEELTAEEERLLADQRSAYKDYRRDTVKGLEGKKWDIEESIPKLEAELPELAQMVKTEEGLVAQTESEIMDKLNRVKDYSKTSQSRNAVADEIKTITKAKENPDVIFSKGLVDDFTSKVEKVASNKYNELISDLATADIKLSKDSWPILSKKITSALNSGARFAPREAEFVLGSVNKLNKKKSHNTSNVLSVYRDLNKVEYGVFQASRNAATPTERAEAWAVKSKIDKIKNELKETLEVSGSGGKAMERLEEANAMWTDVKNVKGNSFYKQAADKGKYPTTIIKQLRGTEEGHDVINKLIRENPKLVETAFGHGYGKNPIKALEDLSIAERDIIRHSPTLDKKLTELGEHHSKLETYPKKEPFTNYHENLPKIEKEFKDFIKDKDGKIPSREKLVENRKKLVQAKAALKPLDSHIDTLTNRITSIEEKKSTSRALANELKALKKELSDAESKKNKIEMGLVGAGSSIASMPIAVKIYDWLFKD